MLEGGGGVGGGALFRSCITKCLFFFSCSFYFTARHFWGGGEGARVGGDPRRGGGHTANNTRAPRLGVVFSSSLSPLSPLSRPRPHGRVPAHHIARMAQGHQHRPEEEAVPGGGGHPAAEADADWAGGRKKKKMDGEREG